MRIEFENTSVFIFLPHALFPNAALQNTGEGMFICEITVRVPPNDSPVLIKKKYLGRPV